MKLSSAVIEETLTLIVQCFSRTYGFFFFLVSEVGRLNFSNTLNLLSALHSHL